MPSSIALLDAPSNLGLRPPLPGVVPGVYKLPWALRECGLRTQLGARDAGVVLPPRYLPDWDGKTVRNGTAIATYAAQLADRIQQIHAAGEFAFVLGGDCSILLGSMLALRRQGQYGLIFIDGHLDFRHPGNSQAVGAAAGEDLALVTGRGSKELTNLEGRFPLVRDDDVIAIGFREDDENLQEVQQAGISTYTAGTLQEVGPDIVAAAARNLMEQRGVDGYWIHLDADVLDADIMPAVDTPTPGGISLEELSMLLGPLLSGSHVMGMELTVFDPDLDPEGHLARQLTDAIIAGFK
jgi:arginase